MFHIAQALPLGRFVIYDSTTELTVLVCDCLRQVYYKALAIVALTYISGRSQTNTRVCTDNSQYRAFGNYSSDAIQTVKIRLMIH